MKTRPCDFPITPGHDDYSNFGFTMYVDKKEISMGAPPRNEHVRRIVRCKVKPR
jgi:hypothetical protein